LDGTTAYATLPDFSSSFDDEATIIGWIKLQQNTSTSVTIYWTMGIANRGFCDTLPIYK